MESGGGHRSWDFLLNGCCSNMAKLLYIKAREVILKDIQLKTNQCIIKVFIINYEIFKLILFDRFIKQLYRA